MGQKYYFLNMNINTIKLSYNDAEIISLKHRTAHSAPVDVQVMISNPVTLLT